MSKQTIKIESLFTAPKKFARQLTANRFLLYKVLGSIAAITLLSTGGYFAYSAYQGARSADAADDPIAHWRFDEMEGTDAYDSSGSGNDGTLENGPTWTTDGKYGAALNFDGVDDYIALTDISNLSPTIAVSVGAWVRTEGAISTTMYIFDRLGSGEGYGLFLTDTGKTRMSINGGSVFSTGATDVDDAQWHYVMGVYDAAAGGTTEAKVYVDGELDGTADYSTAIDYSPEPRKQIGRTLTGSSHFKGSIDDVKIYDYALNAGQVVNEYYNNGPVAYWSFDEGYASTTYDRIGDADATLYDNAQWIEGKFGKAVSLDGTDDWVQFGNLNITDEMTLMFWYNTPDKGTNEYVFDNRSSGSWWFIKDYTGGTCGSYTGELCFEDRVMAFDDDWNTNEWTYVTVTDSASQSVMYINGKQTDTGAGDTGVSVTNDLRAGTRYTNSAYNNSMYDEVKIYNRILTPDEIAAEYNSGGQGAAGLSVGRNFQNKYGDPGTVTDGLVGYWKMDERSWNGTAGEVKDFSGMNNHGTSTNATSTTDQAKFGRSGGFDGNGDYITVADDVSLEPNGAVTISIWNKRRSTSNTIPMLVAKGSSAANVDQTSRLFYRDDINAYRYNIGDGIGQCVIDTNSTFSGDTSWRHITAAWSAEAGKVYLYVDGELDSQSNCSLSSVVDSATPWYFGVNATGDANNTRWDGYMDHVKIYNRALTPDEVMREYVSGPGPINYWSFNEGSGTSVADSVGGFTGTLYPGTAGSYTATSSLWAPIGKVGNALRFDGTDDYVHMGTAVFGAEHAMSAGAWIKPSGNNNEYYGVIVNRSQYAYPFQFQTVGSAQTGLRVVLRTSGSGYQIYEYGSLGIVPDVWQYVGFTYDPGMLKIYIDGVNVQSATASTGVLSSVTSAAPLTIGSAAGVNQFFKGSIDEVKIYDYARTPRQIALDYNGGGPVGYWTFDEGYASTTKDMSGQGNDGTLVDNTVWTMNGKFGKALSFDGTDDYVSAGNIAATSSTLALWVYPSSSTGGIATLDGGTHNVSISAGTVAAGGWSSPTIYINGKNRTGPLETDSWQHVAVASVTAIPVTALRIGTDGTNYFTGLIDDVKIYNYARTPEEIRQDYNAGGGSSGQGAALKLGSKRNESSTWDDGGFGGAAPVLHWSFQDVSDTTVYDTSGHLTHGSINGTASWIQGGAVGQAARFNTDGVTYVTVSDRALLDATAVTIAAWYKSASTNPGSWQRLVGKGPDASESYALWINPTGDVPLGNFQISAGNRSVTCTSDVADTVNWYYLTVTYDGSVQRCYVNGAQEGSSNTYSGDLATNSEQVSVGKEVSSTTNNYQTFGWLDEVKIYDYARTPAQIAWEYNGGKPVAHWKFDDAAGGTARDSSGNGNDGIIYPGTAGVTATSSMWVENGKINTALSFDGTDDYVYVSSFDGIGAGSDFTVAFWMKDGAKGSDIQAIAVEIVGASYSEEIVRIGFNVLGCGDTCFGWYNDYGVDIGPGDAASANFDASGWRHIAAVLQSGERAQLYFDGQLEVEDVSVSEAVAAQKVVIGAFAGIQYHLDGMLDNVKIYNYARTPEEVKLDYNNGAGVRF